MSTPASFPDVEGIVSMLVVHPDFDHREEPSYSYTEPTTRRQFRIRGLTQVSDEGKEAPSFFLEEMCPNGRMFSQQEGSERIDQVWDEPRIRELEASVGPNGLMAALAEHSIRPENMVFVGGGFGVGSIYHGSLQECAQAIVRSLQDNVRYEHLRALGPQEKLRLDAQSAKQAYAYWTAQLHSLEHSRQQETGLFRGCSTMFGALLQDEDKKAILAYLNHPTQKAWLQIRGLSITGSHTLWQAWCEYDPAAPRSGSSGRPSAAVLRKAIPHAVSAHERTIELHLQQSKTGHLRSV